MNMFSLMFEHIPEANSYKDICIPLKKGRNDSKYLIIFSVITGIIV